MGLWRQRNILRGAIAGTLALLAAQESHVSRSASAAIVQYEPVALTGATGVARGIGPNQTGLTFSAFGAFGTFESPVLNPSGKVAFHGWLTPNQSGGVTTLNDAGLWVNAGTGAGPVALLREGDANLGPNLGPDVFFSTFKTPLLNPAGDMTFHATLKGTGINNTNEETIWTCIGGVKALLAREGTPGPGPGLGGDIVFNTFDQPRINAGGTVVFKGQVRGTGVDGSNSEGIWSNAGGSLNPIARSGSTQLGPNLGTGVRFASFRADPALNAGGTMLFLAELSGLNVNSTNDQALFTRSGGTLTAIARTGSAGPGPNLGAEVHFRQFDDAFTPVLNDAGHIAFGAVLTGTGVDSSNERAIFTNTGAGGTLSALVRSGSDGPGPVSVLGQGSSFTTFATPVLNGSGDVAFLGKFTGPAVGASDDSGIWTSRNGVLKLAAREGSSEQLGPGLGDGVAFAEFSDRNRPLFNDAGQVAWFGTLTGSGVTTSNDTGIFASVGGSITPIAREGSLFDVDTGPGTDLRTVWSLQLYSTDVNDRGRASPLSNEGLLTFSLSFTDGSAGVFTAILIPEPGILSAVAPGVWLLLHRRRRAPREPSGAPVPIEPVLAARG